MSVFPNPAISFTNIQFELPESGLTRIVVYDMAGQVIDIVHDGNLDAGQYLFSWDVSTQPTGTYLVRVESAGYVGDAKVIVGGY
jgi:hypothetical protein